MSTAQSRVKRERKRSREIFERAEKVLVGGVNSPVRAFRSVGGEPLIIERGEGPYLYDADGNQLLDFVCSWGAIFLGHANSAITAAIADQAKRGTSFGVTTELELELATLITRDITKKNGALLIIDEVITGFRLHNGAAQQLLGVQADLTTLGKIIGGGLPVAAYGGSADLMNNVAPLGPVYQAGTLAGNPLAMSAGIAALRQLTAPGLYERINKNAERLVAGLRKAIAQSRITAQ